MLKTGANPIDRGSWAGIIGMSLLALAGNVNAVQTVANARSCMGCNGAQMMQSATQSLGLGVGYIYDPNAAVIRKYEVGSDSTCGVIVVPEGATPPLSNHSVLASPPSAVTPNCGAFRSASELYPVDASVQTIFDTVAEIYRNWPSLLTTAEEKIYLRDLPNDPYTEKPFDLRAAAWQYPFGTFNRFQGFLQEMFKDYNSLAKYDIALAKLLYKVQLPSGSLSIGFSGLTPNAQIQLNWDRNNTTDVQICDTDSNCANFKLLVERGKATLNYINVTDVSGNAYPQPSATYPSDPRWVWNSAKNEGSTFAGWLRNNGTPVNDGIGFGTCNYGAILTCAWQGYRLIGCNIQCN